MRSTGISRRLVAGSRYNASVASRAASVNLSERTARARGSLRQASRSEEHTSELQSQSNLVCRLLLEKKKTTTGRYSLSLTCAAGLECFLCPARLPLPTPTAFMIPRGHNQHYLSPARSTAARRTGHLM